MEKIALIVDSACDIKADFASNNNIRIVPFKIIFSHKEYIDGINIKSNTLYELMKNEIPKTSLPSVESYTSALKSVQNEGYTHAIIITISSELSGSFNSARIACENIPSLKTHVYDSMTLTMGEGCIALNTLNLINEGKSFNEIVACLPDMTKNVDVFFTMESLKYLIKGGRIGKVSGTLAGVFNLKPIITVGDDGIYHTVCKIRGINQCISKLASIVESYLKKGPCRVWIMTGKAHNLSNILYERIKNMPNLEKCEIGGNISPVLGVHTGPGLIGMIINRIDYYQ